MKAHPTGGASGMPYRHRIPPAPDNLPAEGLRTGVIAVPRRFNLFRMSLTTKSSPRKEPLEVAQLETAEVHVDRPLPLLLDFARLAVILDLVESLPSLLRVCLLQVMLAWVFDRDLVGRLVLDPFGIEEEAEVFVRESRVAVLCEVALGLTMSRRTVDPPCLHQITDQR